MPLNFTTSSILGCAVVCAFWASTRGALPSLVTQSMKQLGGFYLHFTSTAMPSSHHTTGELSPSPSSLLHPPEARFSQMCQPREIGPLYVTLKLGRGRNQNNLPGPSPVFRLHKRNTAPLEKNSPNCSHIIHLLFISYIYWFPQPSDQSLWSLNLLLGPRSSKFSSVGFVYHLQSCTELLEHREVQRERQLIKAMLLTEDQGMST